MKLALLATLALFCGMPRVAAQESERRVPTRAELERVERLLAERERRALHPSPEPLELVGIAEGDNNFTTRTPALSGAAKGAVQVDPEEKYRRRLALYTERASFSQPVTRASSGGRGPTGAGPGSGPRSASPASPEAPLSGGAKLFACLVGLAVLGYTVWALYKPKGGAEA